VRSLSAGADSRRLLCLPQVWEICSSLASSALSLRRLRLSRAFAGGRVSMKSAPANVADERSPAFGGTLARKLGRCSVALPVRDAGHPTAPSAQRARLLSQSSPQGAARRTRRMEPTVEVTLSNRRHRPAAAHPQPYAVART
jgi:hypothetical protein